ncbi:MAG TPA: YceH family protein [Chitinispirillaceae bacterium]|nr:YceH family protein [Chitinispirillaceae bacterium]
MDMNLSPVEARILGSLIEKEITTPEYYPLSLNALLSACNQKSSRDPVMNLEEKDILEAIDTMKSKRLVWQLKSSTGRVPKYEHNIRSLFTFSPQETAIIDVLLLRGPQTPGELRTRTERLYNFSSLEEVLETLNGLISREDGPFVVELPRLKGQKDTRYTHLFSGMPDLEQYAEVEKRTPEQHLQSEDRIFELENNLSELRLEFEELKNAFYDLKRQLE